MTAFSQDIRYSLRHLRKSLGFTVTSVLILALGIGGTTAIFTLIHAVLLQPLPVKHPEQLYRVGDNTFGGVTGALENNFGTFSFDLYQYFRANTKGFEELAAVQSDTRRIAVQRGSRAAQAESFFGEFVSGNYFPMLAIDAAAGRLLTPDDDRAGAPPVAVMRYEIWQQRYALDASVVGSIFNINGHPLVIAGVSPPGFFGSTLRPSPPDFWIPLANERLMGGATSLLDQPNLHWLFVLGRLRPDANPSEIDAQLKVELRQWLEHHAGEFKAEQRARIPQQTVRLVPADGGVISVRAVRNTYAGSLRLLMLISGFVLLIVCANIANLVLVRGIEERQQTAIRVALGARRSRLVMQALTENVILATLGGLVGLALAYAAIPVLINLAFAGATYVPISARPAPAVLLFAFAISVAAGALFGAVPAGIASRIDPVNALRGAGRVAASGHFLQRTLVVAQAALSLVLLVASGLLIESLRNLQSQNFGFAASHRLAVRIDANLAGYKPDQLDALNRTIRDRMLNIPGVQDVTYAGYAPLSGSMWSTGIAIPGHDLAFENPSDWVAWDRAGPNYFGVVGTRILRGRDITEQDTLLSRRVAVVNETFVQRYFRNEDPLGKHFGKAGPKSAGDYEIVGIAEDTKYFDPNEAVRPMFTLAMAQPIHYGDPGDDSFETRSLYPNDVILKFAGGERTIEPLVRRAFAEIDPNLPVIRVLSFEEQVDRQLSQSTLIVRLTSLFGLTALVLVSIGLYGVTSFTVQRRTREIGIRMALGANRKTVLGLVLRSAFLLAGLGLALGVPMTFAMGRILESKLYGTGQFDVRVLGAAVLMLGTFALIAAWLPARRAASIAPTKALRAE